MKIVFGCTRIVFIFSRTVIKIPRIRLIYPLRRFLEHRSNKKVGVELQKFGSNFFIAFIKYFLSGFYANRLEYLYSKKNQSCGIVPTKALFFGIIVMQQKGAVLDAGDPEWLKLEQRIRDEGVIERDTLRSCNFCIIGKRIRILDYGCTETVLALDRINLKILEQYGLV